MVAEDNIERERRFLVDEPGFLEGANWTQIEQGYVFAEDGYAIRIRLEVSGSSGNETATLTAKGPRVGDERREYEMVVDSQYAVEVLRRTKLKISKRRYSFAHQDHLWDVDVFDGDNAGLIIAELEGTAIREAAPPWWAIREITGERRFNNDELVKRPVSTWLEEDWRSQSIWDDE